MDYTPKIFFKSGQVKMSEIISKMITTEFGDLAYYSFHNESQDIVILFIHGLGENKEWLPMQLKAYSLNRYSWIVPDLIGFGDSDKPEKIEAYEMDQQAKFLIQLLKEEVNENHLLYIMAHSLGGPIAISLIEQLSFIKESKIKMKGLFYLEGNLDKNDAFYSSQIAKHSYEEYIIKFKEMLDHILQNPHDYPDGYYETAKKVGAFPLWATSVDLVAVSESNQLLPRLQKHLQFSVHFFFGEKNKGRFTSETMVRNAKLPLVYIPDTGHFMHLENPETFWKKVVGLIDALD